MYLLDQHPDQEIEHFQHSVFPLHLFIVTHHTPRTNHRLDYSAIEELACFGLYINGIIQDVLFCAWLLSFCTHGVVYSLSLLDSIVFYEYTTMYLSFLVLMYIWFVSILELLQIVFFEYSLYTSNVYIRTYVCVSLGHISCYPANHSRCTSILVFLVPLYKSEVAWEGKITILVCYMNLQKSRMGRGRIFPSLELSASNNNCSLLRLFCVLSASCTLFHLILMRN